MQLKGLKKFKNKKHIEYIKSTACSPEGVFSASVSVKYSPPSKPKKMKRHFGNLERLPDWYRKKKI